MTLFDHHNAQRFLDEHAVAEEAGLISIEAAFIIELLGRIMTTQDNIDADVTALTSAFDEFGSATTELTDEVTALKAQLAAAGVSDTVDTSALDAITAKLKSAADAASAAVSPTPTTVPAGDTTAPATPSTGDTGTGASDAPTPIASTGDATAATGADAGTTPNPITPDQTGDAGSATSTVTTADPTPDPSTAGDLTAASSIPAVPGVVQDSPAPTPVAVTPEQIDTTGQAALNASLGTIPTPVTSTVVPTTDTQEG